MLIHPRSNGLAFSRLASGTLQGMSNSSMQQAWACVAARDEALRAYCLNETNETNEAGAKRSCRVVWSKEERLGVRFLQP